MRYLLRFSYLGTKYLGLQRHGAITDQFDKTVQHAIELSLLRLNPTNRSTFKLTLSSRTDRGVHALMNTAHVDLFHRYPGGFYEPGRIVRTVNNRMRKHSQDITMLDATPVSSNFHARHSVVQRTYVYRLGVVLADHANLDLTEKNDFKVFLPITDSNLCHVVAPGFDLKKAEYLCDVLRGEHDFATFKAREVNGHRKETVRNIIRLSISPSSHCPFGHGRNDDWSVRYYDITVKCKGFLYKLVRKLVATIIGYSQDRINLDEVHVMLNNPHPKNWNQKLETAPAKGLFLVNIKYRDTDLT